MHVFNFKGKKYVTVFLKKIKRLVLTIYYELKGAVRRKKKLIKQSIILNRGEIKRSGIGQKDLIQRKKKRCVE